MTTGSGSIEAGGNAAAQGWEAVRADSSIQYTPVKPPPTPQTPGWLRDFLHWLADLFAPIGRLLGQAGPWLKWVLLAAAVLAALYLLYRLLAPVLEARRVAPDTTEQWAPDAAQALALLEEADRLAREGHYDEATHLLLQRSVGQIASARPDWIEPSSTAREIAVLPALPEAARSAFAAMAQQVERSLFALQTLGQEDWQIARDAYADFALANLPVKTAGDGA